MREPKDHPFYCAPCDFGWLDEELYDEHLKIVHGVIRKEEEE